MESEKRKQLVPFNNETKSSYHDRITSDTTDDASVERIDSSKKMDVYWDLPLPDMIERIGNFRIIKKTHRITKKMLLREDVLLSRLFSYYRPNIIVIRGKRIWFYHGLEEGLMCWDSIDIRRLRNYVLKSRKYKKLVPIKPSYGWDFLSEPCNASIVFDSITE